MPNHLAIEVDGRRVTLDWPTSEAQAREWLIDNAIRLSLREPIPGYPRHSMHSITPEPSLDLSVPI